MYEEQKVQGVAGRRSIFISKELFDSQDKKGNSYPHTPAYTVHVQEITENDLNQTDSTKQY